MKRNIGKAIMVVLLAGTPLLVGAAARAGESPAPKQSDPLAVKLLTPYLAIRTALAHDRIEGVGANAKAIVNALKAGIAKAAKDKKPAAHTNALKALLAAAQPLAGKNPDIKRARQAFGKFSDAFVGFTRDNVSAADAAKYQLFYCPMAKHHWFQKAGEKIGNPYYGKEMAKCGEKMAVHGTMKHDSSHEHMHGM